MRDKATAQPPTPPEFQLSVPAFAFIVATVALGHSLLLLAILLWPQADWFRFTFYAAVAGLASGWKVRFPRVVATLSVNFFFSLLAAVELGLSEAVAISAVSGVIQSCWWPNKRPEPIQIPFNISVLALSSGAAALVFNSSWLRGMGLDLIPRIVLAALAQFLVNSLFVSSIIVLTERTRLFQTLRGMMWSFPYYFLGALGVGLFHSLSILVGWQSALLSLPAAYLVFRSIRLYLDRLESEGLHAKQMSELQRRTIEALALAIECKDACTHDHLSRVQVYALEMGKELGLSPGQTEALRAAALLHDIGKLAVPESIINKPGRLTPEEFNRMKIHPVVGAEILSSVQFPYPVVPYVRSHHEKWDGTGYPDGLKGEEIPIGSRIISTVDCLDALASDRPYRRALPLDDAMEIVRKEAGRAFDPRIVEILGRRYIEFEGKAKRQSALLPKLSIDFGVERGDAPGAGFEQSAGGLAALASAIEEGPTGVEAVLDLIRQHGPQLSFEELMALVAVRLRTLIPNDGMAAYRLRREVLEPVYCSGEDAKLFDGLRIPLGEGLSGWVAENRRPIVNGNPAVEPGYLSEVSRVSLLRSAVSAPIEFGGEVIGVLTLHSLAKDAFSSDDGHTLETIGSAVGWILAGQPVARRVTEGAFPS